MDRNNTYNNFCAVNKRLDALEKKEQEDLSNFYNKQEVDEKLEGKANVEDLENKQNVINDLNTIRSGAALGATALLVEVDPTVPNWAKQPNKPTYTAQEVGALPSDTPLFSGDYNDLTNKPIIPDISGLATTQELNDGLALKADVNNTYTKSEVDGKVSGVYHYKGTVSDYASLPASASEGDVYNVEDTGMNYAWDGNSWDALGSSVDLSNYYNKTETDNLLFTKADTTNTYTKTEVNNLIPDVSGFATTQALTSGLATKADASTTYTKTEVDTALDNKQNTLTSGTGINIINNEISVDTATDSNLGAVKLNSSEGINLNSNGLLDINGRLGVSADNGLYYPTIINPDKVRENSLLLTEATSVSAGSNRMFVLAGGSNVNLKTSAVAGSTQYRLENNFNNRFAAATAVDGWATIDQTSAGTLCVKITSVKYANGNDIIPNSSATDTNNDIIITTAESINPDSAITKIRLYGNARGNDSVFAGQNVGAGSGGTVGKNFVLGQNVRVTTTGNVACGSSVYSSGARSIVVGQKHINTKGDVAMFGTGHDSTSGTSGVAAFGSYSIISADTALVIGNGTSETNRSNLFEVKTNGDIYVNGIKKL